MHTTIARRLRATGLSAHAAAAPATIVGCTCSRSAAARTAALHASAFASAAPSTPHTRVAKPKPFVPAAAAAATPIVPAAPFVPAFPPLLTARARLAHGSSLDPSTFLALFPPSGPCSSPPADLLCCDPPYLILHPRGGGGTDRGGEREATSRKKLLWDLTGATLSSPLLRFPNAATYASFTAAWMRLVTDPRVLRPDAPWIIWTNHLGIKPISDAVQQIAAGRRKLWSQMLWIKPAKPAAAKEAKPALRVQHSIQPLGSEPSSSSASAVAPVSAPWTHAPPPPLSLSLTSNELSFRAYEVALVFGEGRFEDSKYCHAAASAADADTDAATAATVAALSSATQATAPSQSLHRYAPLAGSVVCPYEEDLIAVWESAGAPAAAASSAPASAAISSSSSLLRHPNAKPLRVLLPLLHSFSAPGDLLLDPFAGSGSTGVAALASGRAIAAAEITDVWARYARDQFERNARKFLP